MKNDLKNSIEKLEKKIEVRRELIGDKRYRKDEEKFIKEVSQYELEIVKLESLIRIEEMLEELLIRDED